MKAKWKFIVAPVLLGAGLWLGAIITTSADGGNAVSPGTADDPLVTKSYVDSLFNGGTPSGGSSPSGITEADLNKLKQEILKELETRAGSSGGSTTGESDGSAQIVTVVELQPGETLYASSGTEVIVRNGQAVAVSDDDNGIPDVTAGKDIKAGSKVELNHLLLFPREGRGIKSLESNTTVMFVMVKGTYLHLDAAGSKVGP
ncbi:hypothetical protein [Paenibacillus senegalensis]|uniref:hypothetical protein n=1 Tax=Paenibacillus senegalensis TaxID=1465766 RepID=UPI000288D14D|nr:hypothetical protein [Paenibacillus senegalensis]